MNSVPIKTYLVFVLSVFIISCTSTPERHVASQSNETQESRDSFDRLKEQVEQAEIVESVTSIHGGIQFADTEENFFDNRMKKVIKYNILAHSVDAIEGAIAIFDKEQEVALDSQIAMVSIPSAFIVALTANRLLPKASFSGWQKLTPSSASAAKPTWVEVIKTAHSKKLQEGLKSPRKRRRLRQALLDARNMLDQPLRRRRGYIEVKKLPSKLRILTRNGLLIAGFVASEAALNALMSEYISFSREEAQSLLDEAKKEEQNLRIELDGTEEDLKEEFR